MVFFVGKSTFYNHGIHGNGWFFWGQEPCASTSRSPFALGADHIQIRILKTVGQRERKAIPKCFMPLYIPCNPQTWFFRWPKSLFFHGFGGSWYISVVDVYGSWWQWIPKYSMGSRYIYQPPFPFVHVAIFHLNHAGKKSIHSEHLRYDLPRIHGTSKAIICVYHGDPGQKDDIW